MHRSRRPALAARSHRSLRRSPRAVWRLLRLTPLGAGVAVLAGLPAISAWAQTAGVAANVIRPDGRTATQQQVVGTRTDITTGTVRGDNAFNSFTRFEVGQGQTVNVHVPSAAQRVINIVTDAPVKVDGVLNGLKDGSISGNLVFADPMGMVVSKGGVVNVNSLQVVATTRAHADAMLDAQGRIGEAAVQQLLDGKAPRSAEGRVQIDGKINALERVRIEARRIDVDGRIRAGMDAAHDAAFRAAVSSNGLANATGMVERGGVIELVADDAIRVSGALDASQRQAPAAPEAPQAGVGGSLRLLAENIELAPTARIDVSGLAGGGVAVIGSVSLPVVATGDAPIAVDAPVTRTLVVAKGAEANADAIERGDGGRLQFLSSGSLDFGGFGSSRGGALMGHGGFVELSGRRRIQVTGLVVTTAPKGNTGTLLIDPDDLHITNGAAGDGICRTAQSGDCTITVGTIADLAANSNLVLQADKTLTFGGSDGSAVDLDLSSVLKNHGTQSISFTAHDITFNDNSRLVTGGGDVKLYALGAQDTGLLGTGKFSYSSNIGWGPLSIGSKVEGGTVLMKSGSAIITRGVSSGTVAAGPLARQAGDVTLRAGTLQLDSGSSILAHAQSGSSHTGGTVELTAYALQQWNLGKASATAQATLAGTVKAHAITVNAVARAEATPDGVWGFTTTLLGQAFGAASGLGAAYHETQADAKIDVMGTAVLEAATRLDIAAASENKAAGSLKVFTVDESGANIASAAAIYVKTAGEANLQVKSGAQLTSGGKATLGAYNNATAKSSVKVLSNNSIGGVVVSYMAADVSATANVEAGAVVKVESLELAALQTGNMRNVANSTVAQQERKEGQPAPPTASIGASVAISDINAHATATLGASLSGVGDVTVVADSSLWQNYIAARNDVGGDPTLGDKVQMAIGGAIASYAQKNSTWLKAFMDAKYEALGALTKGSPPVKAGAVVTVNETDLGSKAQIGADAKITSTGQVAVVAQTEDRSVHNVAESKVNTKNAPTAEPVVNAAVAVGLYKHGAEATVGSGAEISSKVFGTYADIYQPLDVTWLAGFSVDGLRDPASLFSHFAPPTFGMPHFVFTSWATALAEQDKIKDPNGNDTAAITGSMNWSSFTNTAKSWVGAGAKITTTDTDRAWSVSWQAPQAPVLDGDTAMNGAPANEASNILLETQNLIDVAKTWTTNNIGEITGFFNGGPPVLGITLRNSLDFSKAVDVKARNQSAFLTLTGQPVDFGVASVNLGAQGGKLAVGGAFNYSAAQHTTVAGIDDGAIIKALAGTVSVDALGQDRIIAIAPTAGTGKGVVAGLIAAYSELDNTTVAVLSNKADVQSESLSVKATEDVSVWSAAGAAAYGASTAAVGLAVAVNELNGRTLATIGDPGALSVGAVRPDGFSGRAAIGAIDVRSVSVLGLTQGTSGAVAASAASVTTEDQSQDKQVEGDAKSGLSKKWESLKAKTNSLRESAVGKLSSTGTGKIADLRNALAKKIKPGADDPAKPYQTTKFSLSAAGSATVNLGNLDTSSVISGATMAYKATKTPLKPDTSHVTARATNDTHQYSISGSLALLTLNAPETKAGYGVSGAIAIDLEDNDTLAHIVNTTMKDYGRVGVESLASGQRISVGLGIAGSSGSKPAYMLSASYSMTESDNSTVAAIDGGKVSSSSDAYRTGVEVLSYDDTETGVGAGALTVQKNKGGAAGASIGVALVHNEVESRIAGMDSDKLASVDVRAFDPVKLGIGAASLGISTDQKSTTLEGSVTYGEIANSTRAVVSDRNGVASQLNAGGAVTVQATDVTPALFKDRFDSVLAANGTPAAKAEYDFGASLRSGSTQESFGGQAIGTSQPGALVIGVAGGVAVGAGNSVGASAALSHIASVHEAVVEGATVKADSVNVDATDATLMVNLGIGVAGTGNKTALAGSVAVTVDETRATARVGAAGKTTSIATTGAGGLDVTSATSAKAFAVAGAVAISTQGSAGGVAGTVGVNAAVAEAQLKNATVNTGTAGVSVLGSTASQQVSVAAAGGYGANASINGSFVINFDTERTTASVSDSNVTANGLTVKAGDDATTAAQVYTGAGSFGFSKDVAGGAALTSNTVALTRDATIDRSSLTLGSAALDVRADSSVRMIGVTVAGGGAANAAFNGAISSNEIANRTTARLAGSTLSTTGTASVLAADRSEMDYGTAAISVAGEAGIGAAIAFNFVTNDVTTQVQGTDANGAKRGSGAAQVGDLRVAASSDEKIVNAAYGVAVAGESGGAGSVAINIIDSDVIAHVGRGADIHADGSVAVTASARDDIKSFGGALGLGSSAGVGLSSTVNAVRGATQASIGADDEAQVRLDAKGNGAGLAVDNGTLTTALPGVAAPGSDPTGFDGMAAMQTYDATRAPLAEGTTTVKGVAVNATSLRHVLSFDTNVGGAVAGVGIGANAGAHVISSSTTADIANASVNQRDAAHAAQDVAVKASSHHAMATFGFSLGASGGGGGAAALGGDVFLTQTTAQIRDSQVKAAGTVTVKAGNESAQSGVLAGIAATGGGSLAGSTGVIVFDAGVEASILGGSTRAGEDVVVDADNASVMNAITGAGALSGGLALSGAITVLVADLATHAYIGRATDNGLGTKVSSGGNIDVKADSTTQVNTFTFALSGGAATSVAAIGSVGVITNDTQASARHADVQVGVAADWVYGDTSSGPGNTGSIDEATGSTSAKAPPAGTLTVAATDLGVVNQLSGAAGINFAAGGGVGGTVSVLVAKSNVSAALQGSEVDALNLAVTSLNSQEQLAATVGVGGATDVGAGFAISLTQTGTGSPGAQAFGNANDDNSLGTKLMNRAASVASASRLGETAGMLSTGDLATLRSQSSRDISRTLTDAGANSSAAFIDTSTVRAGRDVTVDAGQQTALKNIAGAAGIGGLAGLGGTVGVSVVHNASAAQVTGSTITAGGALQVKADSADKGNEHALELLTIAGGVGFAGLGASVGMGQLENQVSAQANGTLKAASISITATDSTSSKAENVAAAAGGGALGVAVSTIERSGTVQAWVNQGGDTQQSVEAGNLSISASTAQDNEVMSRAVAAGLANSGNGAAGTITDTVAVKAGIGDGSAIHVGGNDATAGRPVTVSATRGATLHSGAQGVGVSGGTQIGASVAIATMAGLTQAEVGRNVSFDAGGALRVSASEESGNLLDANGWASGGGVLMGANATVAQSENRAQVRASIGDGTLLPDGTVVVHATHAGTQRAESSGVTVGGLLSLGANTSDAKTSATTSATLGNVRTSATRLGDLDVAAQGLDITTARAEAGGGGLVSGQAATALVSDISTTTAAIANAGATALANADDYTLRGGALTVDATHTAQVRADADTVNASAVGASGAIALTDLNNSVAASVGTGVRLRGLGIALTSGNLANETGSGDNAAGAGGGVANGSAVVAKTKLLTQSSTTVGSDAQLDVVGDPSSDLVGRLVVVAGTDLATHTQGSLNTGGLIDIPYAEIESKTDASNTVTVGTGAQLRSAGDLVLGTSVLNRSAASALVKTYGGVGITGAKSTAQSRQTDRIQLLSDAVLTAYGNVSIATGRNADNAVNLMQANAVTDVYNNTAIPISYQNPASADITQSSTLSLAAGSKVLAGRSVYLRTFKGDQVVSAHGEGHNPYLELFSTSTTDANPSQSFTGSAALNGNVTAGYYRQRDLTIDRKGDLSQTLDAADTKLPVLTFTVDTNGVYRNEAGQVVDASLALRPDGYIVKLDGFNPNLYYDADAKTKLGNVPDAALGAYVLPDLVVAGGNVEVDVTSVSGNGTLRAQGGPLIKVVNESNRFLIGNKLVIPDIDSGGGVTFTGSGAKPASLTVQEVNKGRMPAIELRNSYDTAFGGEAADIVLQAGSGGANSVRNLRGSFKMVNDNGNVWGSAPEALTVDIQVPKGTYVIESYGYVPTGGVPYATWAATDALYRPNDIGSFIDTAAYAYYVRNFANPSTDADTYSKQLQAIVDNGGSGYTGYLFRANLGNQTTSGGNWYGGRYNFDILPVKSLSATRDGTPLNATKSPGLLANRIDITAAYIDINADIRAGTARDIDVTITNAANFPATSAGIYGPKLGFFDCVANSLCRSLNGLYAEGNGQYKVPAAALVYGASSPALTVTYDPSTRRVSTAPVGTASVGSISLIGRILNSNADGSARSKVELSTGTLQLNINNQSGYAFEMPRIETGGVSGDGVIRITDLNKTQTVYENGANRLKPLTTWWVSRDGTAVTAYQSYRATSYKDFDTQPSLFVALDGATATSYAPQTGWRFEWTRSASASRSFNRPSGSNAWWDFYATPWTFAYGFSAPSWQVSSAGPVHAPNNTAAYSTELTQSTDFSGRWKVSYVANGAAQRYWNVATNVTLYQKSSVRADYGLDVSFKGYASGGVSITSNADTFLGTTLNNPTGDTTLRLTNGASLVARDGGLIRSRNLTLSAAGSIGGIGQSKALDLDTTGWLNARSGGSMAINAAGALTLAAAAVGNGKQLQLKAVGDLTTTDNAVTLTGYDISLTSLSGRIGGATPGSVMNLNVKAIGAGVSQRGLLAASSSGDIALNLTGGDTRVSALTAADGNVTVTTNGSLFDAKEAQGSSGRTDSELQQLWEQTLKISGDKAASVADYLKHTITPLDQQVNRDYRDYWALRGLGQLNGAGTQITLNATGLATLRAQAAAALSTANPTDAQVNQWANTLLGRYAGSFDRLLGSGWRGLGAFQVQDAAFRFSADRYNEYWTLQQATDSQRQLTAAGRDTIRQVAATVIGGTPTDAQLQAYVDQRLARLSADFAGTLGAGWASQAPFTAYQADYRLAADTLLGTFAHGTYWGAERLQNEIRASAFGTASGGGSTSIDHLNISGRRVSLTSTASNATLGRDNGTLTLTIGQPLTDIQRYALSQASAPGDVQVVKNAAGQITALKVKDTRPFFVNAKTQFDAIARGQLFVLAQGAVAIGNVRSDGMLRLSAQNGISNAGSALAIQGSSLVLDGGNGSLGSAASPLLLSTPELSLARAANSVYLRQLTGNLVIDVVSAGKDVVLTLNNGSLQQKQADLLSLAGESLTLDVNGDVGTANRALVLEARNGPLQLKARDAWITATGNALQLGDSSMLDFTLRALGSTDVRVSGNVLSDESLLWLIGGDVVVDAGKQLRSSGDFTLTAGSMDMGSGASLVSTGGGLALSSTAGPTVLATLTAKTGMTVDAEGGVIRGRDANATLTVQAANGSLKFNSLNAAGGGIGGVAGGDLSAALRVAADRVSLRSGSGDAALRLLNGNVTVDSAVLGTGSLRLEAAGQLTLAAGASAGADLTLKAAQALTLAAGRSASAGRNLAMDAASLTLGAGSRATAGDSAALLARTGNAQLATVEVAHELSIDAANGTVSQVAAGDQFTATAADGRIALNAGNTAGRGLGAAAAPLRLSAGRVDARSASGDVQLALLRATTLERAMAGAGDLTVLASGQLAATGDLSASGTTHVTAAGAFTATADVAAGADLLLQASRLELAGPVHAGRHVALTTTAGDLRVLDRLTAGGSATLASAGALTARDVQTGLDLGLQATGPISGEQLRAGRGLTALSTRAFTLHDVAAGTDIHLDVGSSDVEQLTAGGRLVLAADTARLGDATSVGDTTVSTRGALTVTGAAGLASGGALRVSADGVSATRLAASDGVELAARSARIATLASQQDAHLTLQEALDLGDARVDGKLTAAAAAADLGTVTAGGAAQLAITGTLTAGALSAQRLDVDAALAALGQLSVAADARLRTAGTLRVDDAATGSTLDAQADRLLLGRLRSGGDATLAATSLLELGSLNSAGTATLSGVTLSADRIEAAGDVDIAARFAGIASLIGHAAARVSAPDSLRLDAADVAGPLTLTAGDARLGRLQSNGTATLAATGQVRLDAWAAQRLTVTAGSATLGELTVGTDTDLRVARALRLDAARTGGALHLQAASAQLGDLVSGGTADVVADGALDLGALRSAGHARLAADALTAGSIASQGAVTVEARALDITTLTGQADAQLRAAERLQLGSGALEGSLAATAAAATLGDLTVGRDAAIAARDGLAITRLAVGGSTQLSADTLAAGSIASRGALALDARTATVAALVAEGDAHLHAAGTLSVDRADIGGRLAVTSGTALFGTVQAAGDATLAALGTLRLDEGRFAAALDAAAGSVDFGRVDIAGAAALRSTGELRLDALQVAGPLTATAARVDGTRLQAGGPAALSIDGDVTLDSADFGADLQLHAHSLRAGRLAVAGRSTLVLGGGLSLDRFSATGDLDARVNEALAIGSLQADSAAHLATAGALRLAEGRIAGALDLSASTADLGQLRVDGAAALAVAGALAAGQLDARRSLQVQAGSLVAGNVMAQGPARVVVADAARLDGGRFGAGLSLTAGGIDAGSLQTSGDAKLSIEGDATLGSADFGADLQLSAHSLRVGRLAVAGRSVLALLGGLSLDRFSATGDLDARVQADVSIGNLEASGLVHLATAGALRLAEGRIAGVLDLSATAADLGQLRVDGDAALAVANALTLDQLDARRNLQVQAASLIAGNVTAAGSATVTVAGTAHLDSGRFGAGLSLIAGDLDAGTVQAGGNAELRATRRLHIDTALRADGRLALEADVLEADALHAGGSLTAAARLVDVAQASAGRSMALGAAERLQLGSAQSGAGLALDGATIELGDATAQDGLTVTADRLSTRHLAAGGATTVRAGDARIGRLDGAGAAVLASRGELKVDAGQVGGTLSAAGQSIDIATFTVAGDSSLQADARLALADSAFNGRVDARATDIMIERASFGGDASLAATGMADLRSLDAAGALALTARQATLQQTAVRGTAALTTQGALALGGRSDFGSDLAADAGALTLESASVAGAARLGSAGAASLGQLQASGTATVKAGGDLSVRELAAADVVLSGGRVTLTSVQAARGLEVASAHDLAAQRLVAGQGLALKSGGALDARLVDAAQVNADAAGGITLDLLKAGTATLRSATQIAIASGLVDQADLQAPRIQAVLKAASGDTLTTRIAGVDGATAESADVQVQAPRWQVPVLNVANAQFSSSGRYAQFDQAHVGSTLMLATADGLLGLTAGTVKVLKGVDVQLFSRSGDFVLTRDGVQVHTSALGLLEKPGQRVSAPNSGMMPLSAVGNGSGPRAAPTAQPGQAAVNLDALSRRAPTAAGEGEDDSIGTLDF